MNDYPLYLYNYTAAGKYGKPTAIHNEAELRLAMDTTVRAALEEQREVRITDTGDECVFHCKGGKILWAGGAKVEEARR